MENARITLEFIIPLHASDSKTRGTALRFYHANGTLWRIVLLE
jgi:hypothetical protein